MRPDELSNMIWFPQHRPEGRSLVLCENAKMVRNLAWQSVGLCAKQGFTSGTDSQKPHITNSLQGLVEKVQNQKRDLL